MMSHSLSDDVRNWNAKAADSMDEMLAALEALGVYPWGYCYCPAHMGDMENKQDDAHCGECRDARNAIAKAKGE